MKRNNAWNIRCLVDESFVRVTQSIILKIVGFQISKKKIPPQDFIRSIFAHCVRNEIKLLLVVGLTFWKGAYNCVVLV